MTPQNRANDELVDFWRFLDFSAIMLHCAFIFKGRKTLDTAIWSLDIVLHGKMIFLKKYFLKTQNIKGD